MGILSFRRGSPRPILAATIALATLSVVALPVSAAGWSTPKTLASHGDFVSLGVAAENNNIVVAWLTGNSDLVYRLSTDKGRTFGPPVNLGAANPAAVTVCGGFVAAVRVNEGAGTVKLDLRSVDGAMSATRTLASSRNLGLTGNGVTCVGGRTLATFWDEWIQGVLHLKVAVVPTVENLRSYEFDLGEAYLHRVRGITATANRIWMAWSPGQGIVVQRFHVGSGPEMRIAKGLRVKIAAQSRAPGVGVAVSGDRVYVGYGYDGDAHLRISNDGGRTFGRARTLYDSPAADPVDFFGLTARENVVVASVHLGPWCGGCIGSNMAVYSTNWGRTWTNGPSNVGGYMPGVALVGSGSAMRIAQAWDNRTSRDTYGDPGYVKFRLGTP